jgi:hypothetical protein
MPNLAISNKRPKLFCIDGKRDAANIAAIGSSKGTIRLSSINYPNSQVTNFSWFNNIGDQRLQQISNLTPTGGTLSQFNYVYDSAGEITRWEQQLNGTNVSVRSLAEFLGA